LLQARADESAADTVAALSARERQLLGHLAQGRSNAQIATAMGLSKATVRNYLSRVYDKLGVSSRAEAIVWARQRGMIDS
jgi:DNA-binding NarL/FixJ family response regulator